MDHPLALVPSALRHASATRRRLEWRVSRWRRGIRDLRNLPREANFLTISHANEPLSQTQIYPFHVYANQIRERHGAVFCEIAAQDFDRTRTGHRLERIRWVAFQTWFDLDDAALVRRVAALRETFPQAELIYLDFFAPLDLRYARVLAPHVDTYVKKQVFRDLAQYGKTTLGDTNLTDFCARRFGLDLPPRCFEVPDGFTAKLRLGSNFCLSPQMVDRFTGGLPTQSRPIDVHARIATAGTDWYKHMREEALEAALSLADVRTVALGRVSPLQFLLEMRHSKICFSPFGYGEVCWRDYEAIFCGALLVKPRMDHVRVVPEIYVPGETYVPVEWDYSDYPETIRRYLADAKGRRRIAANAFAVVRDYIRSQKALDDMAPIFGRGELADRAPAYWEP